MADLKRINMALDENLLTHVAGGEQAGLPQPTPCPCGNLAALGVSTLEKMDNHVGVDLRLSCTLFRSDKEQEGHFILGVQNFFCEHFEVEYDHPIPKHAHDRVECQLLKKGVRDFATRHLLSPVLDPPVAASRPQCPEHTFPRLCFLPYLGPDGSGLRAGG